MTDTDALDALIAGASAELDSDEANVPGPDRLLTHAVWLKEQRRRLRLARRVFVGGSAAYLVLCAVLLRMAYQSLLASQDPGALEHPIGLGIASSILLTFAAPLCVVGFALWLAHSRSVAAQIVARSIFWTCTLAVGVFAWSLAWGWFSKAPAEVFVLIASLVLVANLVCTGALLALGDYGLQRPGQRVFTPTSFRGLLTLSLVMGLADVLVLLTAGGTFAAAFAGNWAPLALAGWLLASAYGLYRLRTWGLIAMAIGNLAELILAATEAFYGLGPFVVVLILTAVVQLLLPLPLYRAIAHRDAETETTAGRSLGWIPTAVLVLFAGIGVAQWVEAMLR